MARNKQEELIRDFPSQQIIGKLVTKPNGDVEAHEFPSNKILGYYRAKYDHTTTFVGQVIAKGNCVVSLIYNNRK